jgi:hypothetical protein
MITLGPHWWRGSTSPTTAADSSAPGIGALAIA